MKIKMIIADRYDEVRDTLKALLSYDPDIEVVAEARNGGEVMQKVKAHSPEILIMDIDLSGTNGLEMMQSLRKEKPGMKIIGLTMYSNRQYLDSIMTAGAVTVLRKDAMFIEILRTVKSVVKTVRGEGDIYEE